jgi:hypothetical protein
MEENQNIPTYSTTKILKASVVAFVLAVIIVVVFILPAEYGVDLTGIGKMTGLTNLSAGASSGIENPFMATSSPYQTKTEKITIQAGEGVEYKFQLSKDNVFLYTWSATQPIYYDFHGEPKDEAGKAFLPYKSYEIETAEKANGSIITEFMGTHGWYWRNDSNEPITVTLTTSGFYEVVGRINSSKKTQ